MKHTPINTDHASVFAAERNAAWPKSRLRNFLQSIGAVFRVNVVDSQVRTGQARLSNNESESGRLVVEQQAHARSVSPGRRQNALRVE